MEILENDKMEEEDSEEDTGGLVDLNKNSKGKSVVIKTSTR